MRKRAYAVFVLCATTAMTLPAQTFNTLFSFDGTDGETPYARLVQATNGDLYGATAAGGEAGGGTVFKITPSGHLTTLYSFCAHSECSDGYYPQGPLVQTANGDFYGTTLFGGANTNCLEGIGIGCGTVFKITPRGTLTTLYSFCSQGGDNCTDGYSPQAGLVQATTGDLYGTTYSGGANCAPLGCGTVFKITLPSGTLTTLYSFCSKSGCLDGANPYVGLVQATNGYLYGTTLFGGANSTNCEGGCGTVFKITPSGTLTMLYSFCAQSGCLDGDEPEGVLVQATNGDLYGTTRNGGANCAGCGTVFKITPSGTLTTVYSFCVQGGYPCTDGFAPGTGLVQATDGNLYGTTESGGANLLYGTAFKITPGGTLTTLYSFRAQDGSSRAELVQATNGNLYGTAIGGGAYGTYGTVFSLSVGLGPFVETRPASGRVGAAVKILGTNLTGATSVTFNGTLAVFKVVSSSLIATSVPAGATTGTVQVVTPSGVLSSNVPFRIFR